MRRILLAILMAGISLPVVAAEWRNTEGSELSFEVAFEGAPVSGEFKDFDVDLAFDAAAPESGSLRVTVHLERADMGDPEMNDILAGSEWLDVEAHADAAFVSDAISTRAPGEFIAMGKLSLKGSVRSVAVPFSWRNSGDQAYIQGTLLLDRTDFDVGSGEWATGTPIGTDVTLHFTVQLVREE